MKKILRHRPEQDSNHEHRQRSYNKLQQYEYSQAYLQNLPDANSDNEEQIFLRQYKEDFLEKQLEAGDTLQTLSIQFNCPIAELKRINNIHRDNEVFARRIIKVPVKYYSLLADNVGVHKSVASGKDGHQPGSSAISKTDNPSSVSEQTVLSFLNSTTSHSNVTDLLSKDDACTVANPKCNDNISDDQVSSRLLPPNNKLLEPQIPPEVFQCSGSDWGLSWLHLLSFTLLLVLGPILYILYHAHSLGSSHNLTHPNTSTDP